MRRLSARPRSLADYEHIRFLLARGRKTWSRLKHAEPAQSARRRLAWRRQSGLGEVSRPDSADRSFRLPAAREGRVIGGLVHDAEGVRESLPRDLSVRAWV